MKRFIIHGELSRYIGRTVDVNCYSVRSFFEYCFGVFPEFRKYFINKIYKGGNFIFIDKNKNHLDAYCSDLILNQEIYDVYPKLEGQAGGPIMGFAMNALMGYGMQKLANKLNPIQSSGKEYEIITTNSWLYSSNENRTEQGIPIPIVYGQLKIGSLVINSNVSNFEFDYNSAKILRPFRINAKIFPDNPNKLFNFDKNIHSLSTVNNFSILETEDVFNDNIISANNDSNESSKRTKLSNAIVGSAAKAFKSSQGNDSYNSHYESDPSKGGKRLSIGPSSSKPSTYNSEWYLDNGSNGGKKPYVFPNDDDLDSFFRPQSSSESCFTLVDEADLTLDPRITRSRVGSRGNYTKLESIGIHRNLDILSEGPIAGLALPITEDPSFDSTTLAFSNDHGEVCLGYSSEASILSSEDNSASFKTISFSRKHNKLLPTSQINEENPSFDIGIVEAGSTYPANLNDHVIIGNVPSENNSEVLEILFDQPLSLENASFAESSIDPNANPELVLDNSIIGVASITSKEKTYVLLEHKHNNNTDGLDILLDYFIGSFLPISFYINRVSNSWTAAKLHFLQATQLPGDTLDSLQMTSNVIDFDFIIDHPLMSTIPHLGILSLNQFRSDSFSFPNWAGGTSVGIPSNFIETNGNPVYEHIPVFNISGPDGIYVSNTDTTTINGNTLSWTDTFGFTVENFKKWSHLLHTETENPLELDVEAMSNNDDFKNLINLGNSLSSSISEDLQINISPDNSPPHLDFTFRQQESLSNNQRQRSSAPYCLDFGFATSVSVHTDPALQTFMDDDIDSVKASLNDSNRFTAEKLKGMLRPYADIRGDSLTLDDISSISITKGLSISALKWRVINLDGSESIINNSSNPDWHDISFGGGWGNFFTTCTRNYRTRQPFRDLIIVDTPLSSLLFQGIISTRRIRVFGTNQILISDCDDQFQDQNNTAVPFTDSFGTTFTHESELNASAFSNRYSYMIDHPQKGFNSEGEPVGGLFSKINAFTVFAGNNEFELTDAPDTKASTTNIGFGDKRAPVSLLLRNETFANDYISKAEELIRSQLNKPNFSFELAAITPTIDANGTTHSPSHIKMIPGVGSELSNAIDGSPAYMYNKQDAWKLDDLTIINDGINSVEHTLLDEDVIEFLDIDSADFFSTVSGRSDNYSRGFYNNNLLYRAEVLVFRLYNIGFADTTIPQYCLSRIDCFCAISDLGRIEKIFITNVPDNPIWDPNGNEGAGMWTPIHPFSHERPSPLNLFNSTDNNSVKVNSPSYQDFGILLKIDSSNEYQEVLIEFNSSGGLKKVFKDDMHTSYSNYVQSQDRPSLSRGSTQNVAQGIVANNVVGGNRRFSLSIKKDELSNKDSIVEPTTEARIDFTLESITLTDSGRYTNSIDSMAAVNGTSFMTGRIIDCAIGARGAGYFTKKNEQIFDRSKIKIFNKLMGVESITISSLGAGSNRGYHPNSVFYIYGFIAKTDKSPAKLQLDPPSFSNSTELSSWWESNSNTLNTFNKDTNLRSTGSFSMLELSCFKALVLVDEFGSVDSVKVVDSGYQLAGSFNDITYDSNELCVHLLLSEKELSLLSGLRMQDTSIGSTTKFQLDYSSGFSSKTKYRSNAQLGFFDPDSNESSPNNNSRLLWPGHSMHKQDLILRIPSNSLQGDNFGKLSSIQMLRPGMGFSRDFSVGNLFEDISFEDDDTEIKFFISTDSEGSVTRLTIDPNHNPKGYGIEDQDLELAFTPRIQSNSSSAGSSSNLDSFSWAYSVFLNDTPVRDHTGRFNFSKLDFNMSCGFFQNGSQSKTSDIKNLNSTLLSSLPDQFSKPLLQNEEFRLPAQTKIINYPLYGPRNNGERDYYYTHTVSNPDISMVALSFKINELHYIYEGDEEIVTLNLMPILGAILGYIGTGKLIEMLGGLAPDPQAQTNAGNSGPACGTAVTGGPGFGVNAPSLSHASKIKTTTKFAKELMNFGLQLIGGVLGHAIASKVPCPSFLCFKVGNLIKNSGEIWPAKIMFKIEYGIEGDPPENWKSYTFTASGCATSPFIKDVYLKDFPKLDHKSDPQNIKKRVVKVYRLTREMDPVQYGIMEARFKLDAELFSATEYIGGYFSYPNTALFAMRTNSKDLPDIPKREFIIKGKLVNLPSFYDASTGTYGVQTPGSDFFKESLEWTSNPAWVIYDLLINSIYGLGKYGIKKEDIDEFSFLRFAKLADEPVTTTLESRTYKERRFMCNLYIDQQRPAYEYIKSLLNLYNATLNFSGGKIYISDDLKRDPIMIFNNSNVTEAGFNYSSTPKTERLTACTVDYLDERDEYRLKSEYYEDNQGISEVGYVHIKIAGIAITRKGEALRLARSKVLTTQMQKEIIQFETGLPASYLRIGDVIKVIDNNRLPNQSSGRILKISTDRRSVEIDIPRSALPNFTSLSIQCVKDEGDMDDDRSPQFEDYEVQNASGGFTINLKQAVDVSVRPGFTWMINKSSNSTFTPQQYQIKNLKEVDGLKFEVIAIEYNPDKFDLIEV